MPQLIVVKIFFLPFPLISTLEHSQGSPVVMALLKDYNNDFGGTSGYVLRAFLLRRNLCTPKPPKGIHISLSSALSLFLSFPPVSLLPVHPKGISNGRPVHFPPVGGKSGISSGGIKFRPQMGAHYSYSLLFTPYGNLFPLFPPLRGERERGPTGTQRGPRTGKGFHQLFPPQGERAD